MISSDEELPKTEPSLRYLVSLEDDLNGGRRIKLRKIPLSPLRSISEKLNMYSPRKKSYDSPKKFVEEMTTPRHSASPKNLSRRSIREEKLGEKDISEILNADESFSSESSDFEDEGENQAPHTHKTKPKKAKWIASLAHDDFSNLKSLKMQIKRGELSPSPPKCVKKYKNCYLDSDDLEQRKQGERKSLKFPYLHEEGISIGKRNSFYCGESDDACEPPRKRNKESEVSE